MTTSKTTSKTSPIPPAELQHFLDTFFYEPDAFLLDEVTRVDTDAREIEARLDTTRDLPIAARQRGSEALHPRHVSGPDLLLITGNLGCLHAYLFHGVRWDEGWVGFGSRIHRADFRELARRGPPLHLSSRETRARVGARRVVLRFDFVFRQEGRIVYRADQSAMFLRHVVAEPLNAKASA